MDSTQWPQGIGVVEVEGGGAINNNNNIRRAARPEKDEEVKCPRCNSSNTKFCYYNNYSLSQPRYFCKTCRRYWTEGGSLRNVPVGGGSRKNKRPSSTSTSPTSSKNIKLLDNTQLYQGQDLNLAFPPTSAAAQDHHLMISKFVIQYDQNPNTTTTTTTTCAAHHTTSSIMPSSAILSGGNSRGLMSSFMSMMPAGSGSGSGSDSILYPNNNIGLQDQLKPSSGALNFSFGHDHHEITNNIHNGAKLLFPFEDPNTRGGGNNININGDHSTAAAGYWTGMLGGEEGSW